MQPFSGQRELFSSRIHDWALTCIDIALSRYVAFDMNSAIFDC